MDAVAGGVGNRRGSKEAGMAKTWMAVLCVVLVTSCSDGSSTSSSSSSTGGSGGHCNGAADCPGGFLCRAGACVTACPINGSITGCVVGSQCINGSCVNNTTCDEQTECAYQKGQVCDFSTNTCVPAADTCVEAALPAETLCTNGYRCHVSVCYQNCAGSKGCPSNKTCQANHTCQ